MKIKISYTDGVLNVPSSVVGSLRKATKEDLQVLLALCSAPEFGTDFENQLSAFAETFDMNIEKIKSSLRFLQGAGVLDIDNIECLDSNMATDLRQNVVPSYTGKQISAYMEKTEHCEELFIGAQTTLKKVFTTHDFNNVILLRDYYQFSNEYILLLLANCMDWEKGNWSYIRKIANNLYDQGIDTYAKLEDYLSARKDASTLEYKIRNLFGVGTREFTDAEKKYVSRWVEEKLDFAIVQEAYNITIAKTQKPMIHYAGKIIDNWHASGLSTVEQIQEQRKEKSSGHSFDSGDFFRDAIARSYPKQEEKS